MADQRPLHAVTESSALVLQEQADEKARLAYDMRQDGKSWYTIAKTLGLTEATARASVTRALEEAAAYVSAETKRQLLVLECDRLDKLQDAYWRSAMSGDIRAAEFALKVIRERIDTLQLKNIPEATVTNNTLVVTGNSEEYVAALRAIAGNRE